LTEGNKVTLLEEYNYKMRGKGVWLLEFFLWIVCPAIAAYRIYNIVQYATSKIEFTVVGFYYNLIVAGIAIIAVVLAIFMSKMTFVVDIILVGIGLLQELIELAIEIAVMAGVEAELPFLANIVASVSAYYIIADVIVMELYGIFFAYIIEHKECYGYSDHEF